MPQEELPAASDAELRGLDGEIAALSSKVQLLQQNCRQMEAGELARAGPAAPGAWCGELLALLLLLALPLSGASFPELRDLNSSMTTSEMAREIGELRKECASHTEKLQRIKSATNHVTPEEKEKVKDQQQRPGQGWAVCPSPSNNSTAEAGGCWDRAAPQSLCLSAG